MRRWLGLLLTVPFLLLVGAGAPAASASRIAAPTITISPASGPPGTVVTIRGLVPGMTAAHHAATEFTLCLDGCVTGYTFWSRPVSWSGPDRFVTHFMIPRTVLLTSRGPLVLRRGTATIGVTCIGPDFAGCGSTTEARAEFHLTRGLRAPPCAGKSACGSLHLSSTTLEPGQLVQIRGWAPLAPAPGQPYALILSRGQASVQVGQATQDRSGDLTGTFRVPASASGLGVVRGGRYTLSLQYQFFYAPGAPRRTRGVRIVRSGGETLSFSPRAVHVASAMSWKSLGQVSVTSVKWSMPLPFTARGAPPLAFAYCVPGGIETTTNGGASWRLVPTSEAVTRSGATTFHIFGAPVPLCQSVTLDPSTAATLYASFRAVDLRYGAYPPPLFSVLYETRDFGASWEPVTPPNGYTPGDFGGISVLPAEDGRKAEAVAIFGHAGNNPRTADGRPSADVSAVATTDGGRTWQTEPLACPLEGPCLRFGAMPGLQPAMASVSLQPLITSRDGGKTWHVLPWPTGNILSGGSPGQSELVWLGGSSVAYVDAASGFPLRVSRDGGRTWQVIALPPPPGSQGAEGASLYQSLMLLPDGRLLAAIRSPRAPFVSWLTLVPGMGTWRADPQITAPAIYGRLLVQGARLYWPRLTLNGRPVGAVGFSIAPLP